VVIAIRSFFVIFKVHHTSLIVCSRIQHPTQHVEFFLRASKWMATGQERPQRYMTALSIGQRKKPYEAHNTASDEHERVKDNI
jgi:hypothetical protein